MPILLAPRDAAAYNSDTRPAPFLPAETPPMRIVICLLGIFAVVAAAWRQASALPVRAPAAAAKKADAAPKGAGPKPATHKVKKDPFKIEVTLKGIFEATRMTEVALRPEAWTPDNRGMLVVLRAVGQGTPVKKGDTLVWLDLEKIDQAIRDLETDHRLMDVAVKQAEDELPVLEKAVPLELTWSERAKQLADEDVQTFVGFERPLAEREANFEVKFYGYFLDYAKEELAQLEKMYRAKDIREETEELVLKRQRNRIEMIAFYLQKAAAERDQLFKLQLPRKDQTLRENALRSDVLLDRARATLPLQLKQKRLTLDKLRYERDKGGDRLRKLRKDREAMTVKAPADGMVYYGKCNRGHWTTAGLMTTKLQAGGIIVPDEVFMTIVSPGPLFVRAAVGESELRDVAAGAAARVIPAADPDRRLAGKVAHVTMAPITPGNFEAKVDLDRGTATGREVAGMECNVKLIARQQADALTVPAKAVFADDLDSDRHHVHVGVKGREPEKREVKVGRTANNKTEILDGLRAGDEILLEKPKEAGEQ